MSSPVLLRCLGFRALNNLEGHTTPEPFTLDAKDGIRCRAVSADTVGGGVSGMCGQGWWKGEGFLRNR